MKNHLMQLSPRRLHSMESEPPHGSIEIGLLLLLRKIGFDVKRIAALYDTNQGRITDGPQKHVTAVRFRFEIIDGDNRFVATNLPEGEKWR